MKCATYARYSTDMQREASIADQVRNCEKYAQREGWQIIRSYADKGISGTKTDRPQYQQMLADAQAHQFDCLLVDDLSRLHRDDIETKQTIRRFRFWKVRLIGVSDGFDSNAKGYKLIAGMRGMLNDVYIDDLREKTHRGMAGQALAGLNSGGRVYGYRHIPIEDPKRKDQYGRPEIVGAKREIDKAQAKVVVRIFERYADGLPPAKICAELNADGIKSPRGGTWSCSCIYGDPKHGSGLLNQPLYIGKKFWNRNRRIRNPDTGRYHWEANPQADWIEVDQPELRIVPQQLWDRVKARQKEVSKASDGIQARLHAKARTGAGPKYLLSSLLKCGKCGGNYVISGAHTYGCANNLNRGDAVCENRIRVSKTLVEKVILAAIKTDLFQPDMVDLFKAECRRILRERQTRSNRNDDDAKRQLARVDREIANLMTAIKAGIVTISTKAELEKLEAERAKLERSLKVSAAPIDNIEVMLPRMIDTYQALVADLPNSVGRDMSKARNVVRELVGGSIRLVPNGGYLHAHLQGDYAGLISLTTNGNKCGAGCPD